MPLILTGNPSFQFCWLIVLSGSLTLREPSSKPALCAAFSIHSPPSMLHVNLPTSTPLLYPAASSLRLFS